MTLKAFCPSSQTAGGSAGSAGSADPLKLPHSHSPLLLSELMMDQLFLLSNCWWALRIFIWKVRQLKGSGSYLATRPKPQVPAAPEGYSTDGLLGEKLDVHEQNTSQLFKQRLFAYLIFVYCLFWFICSTYGKSNHSLLMYLKLSYTVIDNWEGLAVIDEAI